MFAIKGLANGIGGAERVFCTVVSELASRGHDVIAVSFDPPDAIPFYAIERRVRLISLGIGDTSKAAGMRETFARAAALRRLARAEYPDVAVGFMHSMFIPLVLALAGTGIPVVGSEHIVPEHYRRRRLQYVLLLIASIGVSRMTVLSPAIRTRYPWIVRRRMIVMPNPVELPTSAARKMTAQSDHILLSVGRLDDQKDHETLIRAFASVAPLVPNWRLRILGEGALRPHLEQLIKSLGVETSVDLPGVTSEINSEYEKASLFALASRYESFGLATAEAMAHGLAVIGFADCPGTNELIRNNQTGILVTPNSNRARALGDTMKQLMQDPARRKKLGNAARASIDDCYSPRRIAGLWEIALLSLASAAK